LLAPREVQAIRLKQLLAKDYPRKGPKVSEGNTEVSFQYNYG
jgi:hypothetical protein